MPLRTITAPGVEIREIDKSSYSKSMTGTACFIPVFSTKGEPYKYKAITSRSAYETLYGTPDNEAERYGYAAVTEVLNQNGNLYVARLPYDNCAFEKMVGIKYKLTTNKSIGSKYSAISAEDSEIQTAAIIEGGKDPILYDLSSIDAYRTDEAKVPANTFVIVDTTGATYNRVIEDSRKGQKREVIGIIPVVTTAANALFAQKLISADLSAVKNYEVLAGSKFKSLKAVSSDGTIIKIDNVEMINDGLSSSDLVSLINTETYFTNNTTYSGTVLKAEETISSGITTEEEAEAYILNNNLDDCSVSSYIPSIVVTGKWQQEVKKYYAVLEAIDGEDEEVSEVNAQIRASGTLYYCESDAELAAQKLIAENNLDEDKFVMTVELTASTEDVSFEKTFTSEAEYAKFVEENNDKIVGELEKSPTPSDLGQERFAVVKAKTVQVDLPLDPSDSRYGWHGIDGDDSIPETMSLNAAEYFSTIQPATDGTGGFDPEHLKDIGVVVYKMYLDPSEGNKVSYEVVEAYCGSLYKDDKDPNTKVTKFIDTIINSQSNYINFFSNCFVSKASKQFYLNDCDILIAKPSVGSVLGLYSAMTKEDISISKSILDGLNKVFDKAQDINEFDIDIVCDAGVSNIASYLKAIFGDKGPYDLAITDDLGNSLLSMWKCQKASDKEVKMWKTVVGKLDNFCKSMRKDCMFLTECPRPLILQGQKKIIRETKPSNTIDGMIIPYLPAIAGLNTSYGAGYLDWFEQADDYTGDFFWCPPSIKAMGVCINTDLNFNYWDAPAGLNRGVINATDVAFSPTGKQAGLIYDKCWNYAINYPLDGIVLEGQKTLQVKPTALDRINVRRLVLRLERAAHKVLRYFVYEAHTAYTRQRVVDALDPYFKNCKNSGGLYDYIIKCDESNNPAEVIDNNELVVQIGIKPVKTIEFILCDFTIGSTGATWSELGLK